MKTLVLLLTFAAGTLLAAVDGRWIAEFKSNSKKTGTEKITNVQLDLHTSQGMLTGTVVGEGRKGRSMTIQNGKIDGDHITFTTVEVTKKRGNHTYTWEGTLQGDQLSGSRKKDTGKRGQGFVAKRPG
jgi:hypothetical protein